MSATRHCRAAASRFAVDSETPNPHRSARLTVEMPTPAAAASPICENPCATRRSRNRLALFVVVMLLPICYNCPMSWVAQVKAAKSIGCDRKTIGRWVRDRKLTTDTRGRVLLSAAKRVASRNKKQGRRIGNESTQRDAEIRLMANVLLMVRANKDTGTIARFFRRHHNFVVHLKKLKKRRLESPLQSLLARLPTRMIPVLTARLVLDSLRVRAPADRPIKPTKGDREEMNSLIAQLPSVSHSSKPYSQWSPAERAASRRVAFKAFETNSAKRRFGLIESREGKEPFKLGALLLCSRRMACYWHKITNKHYVQIKAQLGPVLYSVDNRRRLKAEGTFDESLSEYLDEVNRNVQLETPQPESAEPKGQRVFADDVASRNKRSAAAQTRKFRDVENEGPRHRGGE